MVLGNKCKLFDENTLQLSKWMCKAFTIDILAHNIAIKRYQDKKIILSHMFHRQTKVSYQIHTLNCFVCLSTLIIFFVKSLPWPLDQSMAQKYLFFAIFVLLKKFFLVWLALFGCLYFFVTFSAIKWSIFPSSF